MAIDYPSLLPPPNLPGYQLQPGQPFIRTGPASGRAGYRRGNVSQPELVSANWDFGAAEFWFFEGWFRWTVKDGADWFVGPAKRGAGLVQVAMRFAGDELYSATLLGAQDWRVTATLEIRAWR